MFQNLEIVIDMRGEIMNYKPLVYVAHPCGSDIKANTKECRNIISMLTKKLGDKYIFISPVLNYSHMYHDVDYINGMETCLSLLQRCSFLLLAGDWKNSKGCLCEYGAARAIDMPISELAKHIWGNEDNVQKAELTIDCLQQNTHGQKLEFNLTNDGETFTELVRDTIGFLSPNAPPGGGFEPAELPELPPLTVANQNG